MCQLAAWAACYSLACPFSVCWVSRDKDPLAFARLLVWLRLVATGHWNCWMTLCVRSISTFLAFVNQNGNEMMTSSTFVLWAKSFSLLITCSLPLLNIVLRDFDLFPWFVPREVHRGFWPILPVEGLRSRTVKRFIHLNRKQDHLFDTLKMMRSSADFSEFHSNFLIHH